MKIMVKRNSGWNAGQIQVKSCQLKDSKRESKLGIVWDYNSPHEETKDHLAKPKPASVDRKSCLTALRQDPVVSSRLLIWG